MVQSPESPDDDSFDMEVEDTNIEEVSQPRPQQSTVRNVNESEMYSEDEDTFSTTSGDTLSPVSLPSSQSSPPLNTATSVNSFWSTLIPPAFLPRGSSATRIRNGNRVSKSLRVFSVAMLPRPRPELENGGKMILPPSFLAALTNRNTQLNGPMLFRISNDGANKSTHCGVLEFIAEEGRCYMPYWRMHNIGVNEGYMVTVENITAQIGKYALFEPQSVEFLDISNPTALLENALRNFACITKGEIIVIHYNDRIYELKVLDTKPSDVLNIIECDMDVDFAPAVGLPKETSRDDVEEERSTEMPIYSTILPGFIPFEGTGCRLNGKPVAETPSTLTRNAPRGQPDFQWKVGNLRFIRKYRKIAPAVVGGHPSTPKNEPGTSFKGRGSTLKGENTHQNHT
ncbi:ubiquitin recognition factor in ER-associated degradation protein 1 isoform X1 [Folsomia candida]|uniref:ubiquitin recognition factor in ER-associated degradation protein 1 isoform X1 n=1 Tax=Folsomia candida TaxID=158441 RepID=UPI001605375D|nr:ubiquitin recognition factor in ER-associated degradation protein 1 isoform X1 [Folsomia candida]